MSSVDSLARVYHADLWGRRALYEDDRLIGGKYHWLWDHDAETTPWTELTPTEPYHFFVPKDDTSREEYERGWSLRDVFPLSQNAIKTDRDDLFIDFDRAALAERMQRFYSDEGIAEPFRTRYRIENSSSYDLLSCRDNTRFDAANIRPFLYRPFDTRWLYYAPGITSRPAYDVMRHMLAGDNLAILTTRKTEEPFGLLCTNTLSAHKSVAAYDINTAFPLYLYPDGDEFDMSGGRRPNLNPKFIADLEKCLGIPFADSSDPLPVGTALRAVRGSPDYFTPEDIFHYAYAILHSPTYRERYAEFLKIDFPRLPLTADRDLFFRLAAHGADLVALHLLQSPKLDHLITEFPEKGTNEVDRVVFNETTGRVHINATQYFGGIPQATVSDLPIKYQKSAITNPCVWSFRVGGYQVCEKWLKDRKGRPLDYADIQHYQKIVVALSETIHLMAAIDQTIEAHGGWPGAFGGGGNGQRSALTPTTTEEST